MSERNTPASAQPKGYRTLTSCMHWPGLGLAVLLFSTTATALPVSMTVENQLVPGFTVNQEATDMPTIDLDGDGLAEVVVSAGTSPNRVFKIFGYQAGSGWVDKQTLILDQNPPFGDEPSLATWADANGAHLLVESENKIYIYSGWPLSLSRSFQIQQPDVADTAVADVDSDGNLELIVRDYSSDNPVRGVSLQTGVDLWTISLPLGTWGGELMVAQLDADPAQEIVLSGTPGVVLDGATHATDWSYKDGFGITHQGRFGGSVPQFASLDYDKMVMFRSGPWSPIWDLIGLGGSSYIVSAVADIDGDAMDEVLYGSSFMQEIKIIDVVTQSVRGNITGYVAYQMKSTDFDGDGQTEIGLAGTTDDFSNESQGFIVANGVTGTQEYQSPEIAPGRYLSAGFVENAGDVDLIFASYWYPNLLGTLTRVNARTGEIRWQSAAGQPQDLFFINEVQIVRMEGQTNPTLFALGETRKIAALDAGTGNVLWTIDNETSPIPPGEWFNGFAAVSQDADADADADALLVCTSERRLRLFDMASQLHIWSSVQMSSECVDAMEMTTNGSKQLVAVLDQALRAYDAQTHLLSWSLPTPNQTLGASFLAQGVSGPEIATFNQEEVRFYDAETRVLLRSFTLGSYWVPISAIAQPEGGSIHDLAVAIGNRLHILDGETGELRASSSKAMGFSVGLNNQLPVYTNPDGSWLVSVGSDVAVTTFNVAELSDTIFASGFENP